MGQIQKCPHCGKDGIFSRSICPHCGYESSYEERLEPDYKVESTGEQPEYFGILESELSVSQRSGAFCLVLILCSYLFPLLLLSVGGLVAFSDPCRIGSVPLFRILCWSGLLGWACWLLWSGCVKVRGALTWYGFLSGLCLCGYAVYESVQLFGGEDVNGVYLFCSWIFGLVHLWSSRQLHQSRDITEFLRYRCELRSQQTPTSFT